MKKQEQSQDELVDIFYSRYESKSDKFIVEILRSRKDYQESAVQAALKIAQERRLINSEQDLMAPEYQETRPKGFSFFPLVSSEYHQNRLIGSIFRFLYTLSFIPAIYGFLNYGEGNTDQAVIGAAVALIWFGLTLLLQKTKRSIVVIPQLFVLSVVFVVVGLRIIGQEEIKNLDVLMLLIGILTPAYLLIYCKKIIDHQNSGTEIN